MYWRFSFHWSLSGCRWSACLATWAALRWSVLKTYSKRLELHFSLMLSTLRFVHHQVDTRIWTLTILSSMTIVTSYSDHWPSTNKTRYQYSYVLSIYVNSSKGRRIENMILSNVWEINCFDQKKFFIACGRGEKKIWVKKKLLEWY